MKYSSQSPIMITILKSIVHNNQILYLTENYTSLYLEKNDASKLQVLRFFGYLFLQKLSTNLKVS